ncbi:MAG: glycerophosphodiester phosphodiesterase [Christensenellales bacterium]
MTADHLIPGGPAGEEPLTRPVYPTLITAHAGAENTVANTLDSLQTLLRCGADAVEVDVHRVAGALILSHDLPSPGSQPATLHDALALLAAVPGVLMNLDIKMPGIVGDILQTAHDLGVQDRLLMTGDIGPEDDAVIQAGDIPLWLNSYLLPVLDWVHPVQGAARRGYSVVNIDKRVLTDEMLRREAARYSVWTVNEEAALRRLLLAGVKNITSRQPLLALRLRGEIQQPR